MPHTIIAIGASAGGLKSLKSFFDKIPDDSPYTFVVIQHLSPDHKSLTDELLAKHTDVPITVIKQDSEIEKNHIYLIPPSKNLVIEKNRMRLLKKPKSRTVNLPIDIFFESVASVFGEQAVGVILSGTGSDGSKGIRFLKEKGGLVVVQDPKEADFDGMPENAIKTGLMDFILPAGNMYREIENYFKYPRQIQNEFSIDEDSFKKIINLLKANTTIDFTLYKRPTLLRRMIRRMKITGVDSLDEYLTYLQAHDEESEILYRDSLIGVTDFFRDSEAWDVIKDQVIPNIVRYKEKNGTIKIWDVGCNSGEETYTLAMLFFEECKKQDADINLKIFATDISERHLESASKGVYSQSDLSNLDADYLSSYFVKEEDKYKVDKQLRRSIIFSSHNILRDPPFTNIDLVVCRNLMIYLQNHAQRSVLKALHYSLKLDGYLMLGPSENLGGEAENYEEVSRKWKIYRNIKISSRFRIDSGSEQKNQNYRRNNLMEKDVFEKYRRKHSNDMEESLSSAILEQFNATTIRVDEYFNIIEAKGNFARFAKLPKQGFSTNLLVMLPDSFNIPLTTSVRKAKKSNSKVLITGHNVSVGKKKQFIDIMVLPLKAPEKGPETTFVITLLESDLTSVKDTIVEKARLSQSAKDRIKDLEEELDNVRNELHQAIDERETSNEELQTSNEELLSSNEELQSTNEELQSVNEELHTMNDEHLQKLAELETLNLEIDNILESTHFGVVFLDLDLRIRKFTPNIKKHFDLLKQDINRPIENFILNFGRRTGDSLVDNAKKVIANGKPIDKRVLSKDGQHFLKRITPFRNTTGEIEGVVITFIDIEEIHQSQEKLRLSQQKFKEYYDSDPIMHVSVNPDTGKITECNNAFVKTLEYTSKKDVVNKSIFDFYDDESRIKASKLLTRIQQDGFIKNEELVMRGKSGKSITVILNSNIRKDEKGNTRTISTLLDISELKEARMEMNRQKEELQQANKELEQFVSICSHDLQEPLSTIRFGSDILYKKFSENLDSKGKEYISYIYSASERLGNQIKALLEHSRIGQNLKKSTVNIKELVEVVKYDLSKSIQERNAKITGSKLPKIKGYETELRLLFQNLISNALKYSKDEDAPDIRVSAFKDGEFYIFSVSDNGIGIPEEDLERVFEIFSRSSQHDKYNGTGVGLAHCMKIVKLHGGKMWVDSQVGVGSTFHFKLLAK
jgi:two-component system CheB/CheR fusion protein